MAHALLNTSQRFWYSAGMVERFGAPSEPPGRCPGAGCADFRQWVWQNGLQPMMAPVDQFKRGLCHWSQENPNTTGIRGDLMSGNWIASLWFPDTRRWTGVVFWMGVVLWVT